MSYVYRQTGPALFVVGFYDSPNQWVAESEHATFQEAAQRVHWLNGGGDKAQLDLERRVEALEQFIKPTKFGF